MARRPSIRLPRQWTEHVKSGVLVEDRKHLPVIELRRAA